MPTYQFRNKETNEIADYVMKISELDTFKANNPQLELYHDFANLPVLSDGERLSVPGTGKADSTFEKYVIGRIKESVPGNTIKGGHKHKAPREW